jgi:hypothetical protein
MKRLRTQPAVVGVVGGAGGGGVEAGPWLMCHSHSHELRADDLSPAAAPWHPKWQYVVAPTPVSAALEQHLVGAEHAPLQAEVSFRGMPCTVLLEGCGRPYKTLPGGTTVCLCPLQHSPAHAVVFVRDEVKCEQWRATDASQPAQQRRRVA